MMPTDLEHRFVARLRARRGGVRFSSIGRTKDLLFSPPPLLPSPFPPFYSWMKQATF